MIFDEEWDETKQVPYQIYEQFMQTCTLQNKKERIHENPLLKSSYFKDLEQKTVGSEVKRSLTNILEEEARQIKISFKNDKCKDIYKKN